jgi:ribosomal protection tetracycline resistance protein
VEGAQAQTRVLMRTLRRLRIPTLIFVNKIDRRGVQPERVVRDIRELLTPAVIAMGRASRTGSRDAVAETYDLADEGFAARLAARGSLAGPPAPWAGGALSGRRWCRSGRSHRPRC